MNNKERLSAFLDNALEPAECTKALSHDTQAIDRLGRYALIQQALKGQSAATNTDAFTQSIAAAISSIEPDEATHNSGQQTSPATAPAEAANDAWWKQPRAIAAAFAVAMAVPLAMMLGNISDEAVTDGIASSERVAEVITLNDPLANVATIDKRTIDPRTRAMLRKYMDNHMQQPGNANLVSAVRFASFE